MSFRVIDRAEIVKWTRTLFEDESSLTGWRQSLRVQICPFENLLNRVPAGADVLDIGCGGGLFLGLLSMRDPDIRAKGIDSSGSAIGCANRMAKRLERKGLTFQQSDRTNDWPQEKHNLVSLIDILHHLTGNQPEVFFKEAASRVAPGGWMLCKDMRKKPRWRAIANGVHDLIIAQQWIRHVDPRQVETWGRDSGLSLVNYEEWDRLWYGHAFWTFRRPK